MRKILNYLLGEELVNEQSDREINEAFAGVAMCAAWIVITMLGLWVVYG